MEKNRKSIDDSTEKEQLRKMPSLNSEFAKVAHIWTYKRKKMTEMKSQGISILSDGVVDKDTILTAQFDKFGITQKQHKFYVSDQANKKKKKKKSIKVVKSETEKLEEQQIAQLQLKCEELDAEIRL